MKTKLTLGKPVAAFLVLCIHDISPVSSLPRVRLTPPGAPAPMMKSLQEIEPRTLIAIGADTISAPGSYYLSNNITVATGNAITISAVA